MVGHCILCTSIRISIVGLHNSQAHDSSCSNAQDEHKQEVLNLRLNTPVPAGAVHWIPKYVGLKNPAVQLQAYIAESIHEPDNEKGDT